MFRPCCGIQILGHNWVFCTSVNTPVHWTNMDYSFPVFENATSNKDKDKNREERDRSEIPSQKLLLLNLSFRQKKSQGPNHHRKNICTALQTAVVKIQGPSWKGPNALRIQDLCSEQRALHPPPLPSFREASQRVQTCKRAVPRPSSPRFAPQSEEGNGKI